MSQQTEKTGYNCFGLVLNVAHVEGPSAAVLYVNRRAVDTVFAIAGSLGPPLLQLHKGHLAGAWNTALVVFKAIAVAIDDLVLLAGTDVELGAATAIHPDGVVPETIATSTVAVGVRVLLYYL